MTWKFRVNEYSFIKSMDEIMCFIIIKNDINNLLVDETDVKKFYGYVYLKYIDNK